MLASLRRAEAAGIALPVVLGVVGGVVIIALVIFCKMRKEEVKMVAAIQDQRSEIDKLKDELTLLKAYGQNEQDMIAKENGTLVPNSVGSTGAPRLRAMSRHMLWIGTASL